MGKKAARLNDVHVCPATSGAIAHTGGPINPPCSSNVNIGGRPAARMSDKAVCVGPMDMIAQGSGTVNINGLAAARQGDSTVHGGKIVQGCSSVNIGD